MIGHQAPPTVPSPQVSVEAFEALAALQQLTLEAGLSESLPQLIFRILNRSVGYCRYDRAALWGLCGRHPKLLGVSGQVDVKQYTPLVSDWRRVVTALPEPAAAAIVDGTQLGALTPMWEDLAQRTRGLSVAWLPIVVEGRPVAGLWLERWGSARFTENDLARLGSLAVAYGVAWRSVARRRGPLMRLVQSRRRLAGAALAAALLAVLCLVNVPLRVVAPCEIVPKDPVAVAAPLNGVLDKVPVLPGRQVAAGELLAVYDKRVALEELKVARQQVQIIESDLQRARVQAFDDPTARAQIALLENRLEQERTRLRIAQYRADRLEVRAPVAGTLMLNDPQEWSGRPVQVGERLMMIVNPRKTKVRVWLPEHDNIAFDRQRPLAVVLDSDPRRSRPAVLRFLANHSQVNRAGQVGFRAEADWLDPTPDLKPGLQGSAVLYGPNVPLGYWLVRRPLAAVRQFLGL